MAASPIIGAQSTSTACSVSSGPDYPPPERDRGDRTVPSVRLRPLVDRAELLLGEAFAVARHEALQVGDLCDLAGELPYVAGRRHAAARDDAEGVAEWAGLHRRAVGRCQLGDAGLIARQGERGSPVKDGSCGLLVELALTHPRRLGKPAEGLSYLGPVLVPPIDIGTQLIRGDAAIVGEKRQRLIAAAQLEERTGTQLLALAQEIGGDVATVLGSRGGIERGERRVRLAIEKLYKRQPCRDPCLILAVEAELHVVLQQRRGAVEKIDGDQPVDELLDQLVALGTRRGHLVILLVESERLEGRHVIGLRTDEEIGEGVGCLLRDRAMVRMVGKVRHCLMQGLEPAAIIAILEFELAEAT